jgi:hypothetical protein
MVLAPRLTILQHLVERRLVAALEAYGTLRWFLLRLPAPVQQAKVEVAVMAVGPVVVGDTTVVEVPVVGAVVEAPATYIAA